MQRAFLSRFAGSKLRLLLVLSTTLHGLLLASAVSAQVSAPSEDQERPAHVNDLHSAARSGNLALLQSLLSGANPDARDAQGRTPLMDAVVAGQIGAVSMLLAAGADPNAISKGGITPLIEAATKGRLEVARLLVRAGANVNLGSRGLGTPLEAAERSGHNDIAAMLRETGARTSGKSVGDKVCVRLWDANGFCGIVQHVNKTRYRIRVTEIVGCAAGCPPKGECSAGKAVGNGSGIQAGDEVKVMSWCLTHTGVKP